ncbi:MAG: hypothetical protein A3B23_01835 [Candidatus Colwellbacteria bacterium RIFCSPLOWO2_01_FULL_48_10]|uniref:Uncharacterized protein n=1 Tax=Candidatus Colwellbacteria bacterium RIFCSPLOWO2_01_FULL_48_10 TaxID=1797690 RepID=A0A1G1Z7J1_9BACT|nr:MAG: hypothetical protein A3B23_01835 [Candidatus Colwellbacteria bacterium RIFCSPLOWO2_01_FULL_48_10]
MKDPQINFEDIRLADAHRKEIESIGASAEQKRVDYAEQGIAKERKDLFREAMSDHAVPTAQSTQTASDANNAADEVIKIKSAQKSEQLKKVMEYASAHGPIKASLLVRRVGDPWLEDQFHDIMVRFHDELIKRNQLKEE